jgi:hypothetical protein
MDMRQLHAPVIIASLLFSNMAHAQSTAIALKEFGLFGTWAHDCGQAAAPTNEYAIFSLTSVGTVQLRNEFGPYYDTMVYRISDARRIGADLLSMRQFLVSDNQIRLYMVLMRMDDQIRILSSRGADGTTFVQDGKMPSANGQQTGWMVRCPGEWTAATPRVIEIAR